MARRKNAATPPAAPATEAEAAELKRRQAAMASAAPAILATLASAGMINAAWPLVVLASVPLAPSANTLTTNASSHRGRFKSAEAERYDQIVRARLTGLAGPVQPRGIRYAVTMLHTFESLKQITRSDADNRIKQTLDSVASALGFNDARVYDVRSIKAGVALFDQPATLVIVQTVPTFDEPAMIEALESITWR